MFAQKHFLRDSLVFQSLNWLIKPVWIFLIDREVQNYLGLEVYGNYQIHFNFTFLFIILLDIGMHNYQTREVAADKGFLKTGTPGLIWIKLFLSLFYMFFIWSAGLLNGLGAFWLLAIGLNQVLNSWILFFRTTLAGLHLFRVEAVVSVLDRFLAGVGCGIFLFNKQLRLSFGLEEFVLFQTAALSLGLLFVVIICIRKGALVSGSFPDFSKAKSLFKANLPFAVLTLIMTFYTRLDVLLLHFFLPETANYEAGIYAHSFRFLDAASMYVMLFTGMLLPVFSKQLAAGENFRPLLRLVFKFVWIPGFWLLALALNRGAEIMDLLYTTESAEETAHSASVFSWLMGAYLPMAGGLVLGVLLTAGGYIKNLIYATSGALAVLAICAFIFIPGGGALGAAKAVVVTQVSVMFFSALLVRKHFPSPNTDGLKLLGKLLLAGGGVLVTAGLVNNYTKTGLLLYSLITLMLTGVFVLVLKLFTFSQLKKLHKD